MPIKLRTGMEALAGGDHLKALVRPELIAGWNLHAETFEVWM
jgi:hypothetical protein